MSFSVQFALLLSAIMKCVVDKHCLFHHSSILWESTSVCQWQSNTVFKISFRGSMYFLTIFVLCLSLYPPDTYDMTAYDIAKGSQTVVVSVE